MFTYKDYLSYKHHPIFINFQTQIQLNMNVLLREEDYFKDGNEFIPERWLRGADKTLVDSYLVLPFSHGARMCIGT